MKDVLHFEPLTAEKYQTYIDVGTRAYNQHYLQLWPSGKSKPYIESSFTKEVLSKEESDVNTILYIIELNGMAIGIFKITLNCSLGPFTKQEALYIDKIYILNAYSGQGIGKKILRFVQLRAKTLSKKIIWLDTMQRGLALSFYQKNGFKIYGESRVLFETVLAEESLMWVMTKEVDS